MATPGVVSPRGVASPHLSEPSRSDQLRNTVSTGPTRICSDFVTFPQHYPQLQKKLWKCWKKKKPQIAGMAFSDPLHHPLASRSLPLAPSTERK
jgi:hypothetical protein